MSREGDADKKHDDDDDDRDLVPPADTETLCGVCVMHSRRKRRRCSDMSAHGDRQTCGCHFCPYVHGSFFCVCVLSLENYSATSDDRSNCEFARAHLLGLIWRHVILHSPALWYVQNVCDANALTRRELYARRCCCCCCRWFAYSVLAHMWSCFFVRMRWWWCCQQTGWLGPAGVFNWGIIYVCGMNKQARTHKCE